jgi:hypothetical protein
MRRFQNSVKSRSEAIVDFVPSDPRISEYLSPCLVMNLSFVCLSRDAAILPTACIRSSQETLLPSIHWVPSAGQGRSNGHPRNLSTGSGIHLTKIRFRFTHNLHVFNLQCNSKRSLLRRGSEICRRWSLPAGSWIQRSSPSCSTSLKARYDNGDRAALAPSGTKCGEAFAMIVRRWSRSATRASVFRLCGHSWRKTLSLFQPPDSRYWWYSFYFEGKRYRNSTKQSMRTAAAVVEATLLAPLQESPVSDVRRKKPPPSASFRQDFSTGWTTLSASAQMANATTGMAGDC